MPRAVPKPPRPDLIATRHVAVAGHPWAATAAFAVLEAGGNAVDAGVAAGIATDVLESEFVCFGGVLRVLPRAVWRPGASPAPIRGARPMR